MMPSARVCRRHNGRSCNLSAIRRLLDTATKEPVSPLRYYNPGMSISARLAEIVLPDTNERQVRLGSLWAEAPAVVVFLRHYG